MLHCADSSSFSFSFTSSPFVPKPKQRQFFVANSTAMLYAYAHKAYARRNEKEEKKNNTDNNNSAQTGLASIATKQRLLKTASSLAIEFTTDGKFSANSETMMRIFNKGMTNRHSICVWTPSISSVLFRCPTLLCCFATRFLELHLIVIFA